MIRKILIIGFLFIVVLPLFVGTMFVLWMEKKLSKEPNKVAAKLKRQEIDKLEPMERLGNWKNEKKKDDHLMWD